MKIYFKSKRDLFLGAIKSFRGSVSNQKSDGVTLLIKLHFQKTKITIRCLNLEKTIEGYSDKEGLFEVPLFTLLKVTEEEGHPGEFQGSIKEGEIIIDHNKESSNRIRTLNKLNGM